MKIKWAQCGIPITPVPWKMEARGSRVQEQPGQFSEILSQRERETETERERCD
jgi:hypothetical protein